MITTEQAFARARAKVNQPPLNESQRLAIHLRKRLDGQPPHVIDRALAEANLCFADGAGHMQTALDAGVAWARAAQ